MAKNSNHYILTGRIDRLLVGSKLGIVGYRHDITEAEAWELIKELEDEKRNIRPVEDISPWERPTPPQNQAIAALIALKQNPHVAVLETRRKYNIPDSQMMTRNQLDHLIIGLKALPTKPGKEEEFARAMDSVLKPHNWAARV